MSKWRIFIVCLVLLTLMAMLVPGCDTEEYTLTIEVNPSGGGTTSLVAGTHDYDNSTEIDVTATAANGYVFDHWSGDASGNTTSVNITMTSNKSITANFAPAYNLTVNVEPVGAGEVTRSDEGPYKEDTEVTLTATPADGYVFDYWSSDASGNTTSVNITMTSNKSITANFAPAYNLTVNVEPVGAGEVTRSDEGPYKKDTKVTLTATPDNGYVFDHWSGDASGDSSTISITMDSNKTVTAHFTTTVLLYTLTVNISPSYGGTVEISPLLDFYEPGTVVTLTAKPYSGNSFDYWSGDLIGKEASATIIMDSDMNITARFDCG